MITPVDKADAKGQGDDSTVPRSPSESLGEREERRTFLEVPVPSLQRYD